MSVISLFKYKRLFWASRLNSFFEKKHPEAIEAYISRVPDKIGIQWQRDGNLIVGKVTTDDFSFITQGASANEFIEMVNEALLISYDIPSDYVSVIIGYKKFTPSAKELVRLNDQAVKKSNIQFEKELVVA